MKAAEVPSEPQAQSIGDSAANSVRSLRRRWKPHKERLQALQSSHPTIVRFHRACSWLAATEERDSEQLDELLILRWIAFNSLYGQWDVQQQQPRPDRECWREFVDRIWKLDQTGKLTELLREHKPLVLTLLDDAYLSQYFWQEPTEKRKKTSRNKKSHGQSWYVEKRWLKLLDEVLNRIYTLRCQIIHGAATHNSQLNRRTLRHGNLMLTHLLTAQLEILIDCGADEDWGEMCYPPL